MIKEWCVTLARKVFHVHLCCLFQEKEFIEKFDEVAREGVLKAKGNTKMKQKIIAECRGIRR